MIDDGHEEETDSLQCSKCRKCDECNVSIKAVTTAIRLTMMEINEVNERNLERRHRELIELLGKRLGSDRFKTLDLSRNIKLEDFSSDKINESTVLKTVPDINVINSSTDISETNNIRTPIRKRQENINESSTAEAPPQKISKPQNSLNIQASQQNIGKGFNQREELHAMRQKLLDMQRRKMEDRKRKKLVNSQI